jgi:hypothetical protein
MKNNLLKLLFIKKCTIKELKVEVIMVIVFDLLNEFLKENKNAKELIKLTKQDENDLNYIKTVALELVEFIGQLIISSKQMEFILINAQKSKELNQKALLVEPIAYFHSIAVRRYNSSLTQLCKEDKSNKIFWMPELLAFNLINDLKEKGYSYSKFDYVSNYDFERVFKIYIGFSKRVNQELNLNAIDNKLNRNLISKMNMLSSDIINSLVNSKYETNRKKNRRKGK